MFFHKWAEVSPAPDGWQAMCCVAMSVEPGQWSTGCPRCGTNYTVDWSSAPSPLEWALGVASRVR